tara:strand:+ start:1879 stop:3192 length:1314 start_codon:yes stop_codon:yes gene_type:complete
MYSKKIEENDAIKLLEETKKLKLFKSNHRRGITTDGKPPYSNVYGWTNKQFNPKARGREHEIHKGFTETKLQKDHPEFGIYVKEIAEKYLPPHFYYNCIQINKNCKCKKHLDGNNVGNSVIIGLGDYKMGQLNIDFETLDVEPCKVDIKNVFTMFDGSKHPHWTDDWEGGDRYSLIFFNCFKFNYRIAIPTYNRPNIIFNKTLCYLNNCEIDRTKIDIFIKDDEQIEMYGEELQDYNIIKHEQDGIGATRNYIRTHYYESDTKYVACFDDDIDYVKEMDLPIYNLDYVLKCFFGKTEEVGLNIWGVNPHKNAYYYSNKMTTDLRYMCGAFFGFIVDKNKEFIHSQYNHLEDYSFSCEHFIRDKGVVKFCNYGFKTKYFGDGGINDTYGGLKKRVAATKILCKEFQEQYGKMCRVKTKEWGKGYDNIVLNYRFKHESL